MTNSRQGDARGGLQFSDLSPLANRGIGEDTTSKSYVNLIMKAFDNEIVGAHINQMKHGIIDISSSPDRLLTSDRPVQL